MPGLTLTPFAALRHRNFRRFYIGQTISLVGTWMQQLAQGWLVLQLTDSALWVGLVSFLNALPILLFSLPAGAWVDRADKRRLVTACQALFLVNTALLTALVATGVTQAWMVGAVALAGGCISAVEIPARQSFIVELVGKDDLTNAIALNSSAFNATRIVGPAIAGVLVARVGLVSCFAINVLTYVAVLVALRGLDVAPTPRAVEGDNWQRLRDGLRYVRGEAHVLGLIVSTALLSLLAYPYVVLLPVFARDVLRVGAEGLGVMSSAVGFGALAAALGLATLAPRVRRGRLVVLAGTSCGLAVAGFAYARWFPVAVLLLAASGFAMVLNNAATNTLLQSLVPDEMRGRVMALWSLVFVGFAPLGSLQAGWLATRIGPSAAVAVGALLAALLLVQMWRRVAPGVKALR